jgi:hypothetical protein
MILDIALGVVLGCIFLCVGIVILSATISFFQSIFNFIGRW